MPRTTNLFFLHVTQKIKSATRTSHSKDKKADPFLFVTHFYNLGQTGFTCLYATSLVVEDSLSSLRMLQLALIKENTWEA